MARRLTAAATPARPRIIDCHGHVRWYGYDARKLVENMDAHGIERMWLLSWEAPRHEIDAGTATVLWPGTVGLPVEFVLEAATEYPDRFIPFYAPDPRRPEALPTLRGLVQHNGVRGCGELKCRLMMDDPNALELFHYCGEAGLPVIFHVDVPLPRHQLGKDPGFWYCCDWDNLARALERCPRTKFLGHGPGFWREISGDADQSPDAYPKGAVTPGGRLPTFLERYSNLHCDLSAGSALNALSRDKNVGRDFFLRYQDRCLFGRDYFDSGMHDLIKSLRLTESAYRKIMSGNALRLVPV